MSNFKEIFEKFGFRVEQIASHSYIADNGKMCIPFSEYYLGRPFMCGVSFDSREKEKVMSRYSKEDEKIGFDVYEDFTNGRLNIEPLGFVNRKSSPFEVETVLYQMKTA